MENRLKIISSNIRFASEKDGRNDWPFRIDHISELLLSSHPDFIGTQEGREPQARELEKKLSSLKLVDRHREWIEERMYPNIWFNDQNFKLLHAKDIWLSETPNVPGSKSFDSAFPRLVVMAKFEHLQTKKKILIANCHLDHLKESTRISQSSVLMKELSEFNEEKLDLILMGDFNSDASLEVRKNILGYSQLLDPWHTLKLKEETTFHHFEGDQFSKEKGARIDWIIHSENFEAIEASIIKDQRNGIYPSDHYPVMATLSWRTPSLV